MSPSKCIFIEKLLNLFPVFSVQMSVKLYENSGFYEQIEKFEEFIATKLSVVYRSRRLSCHQILEMIKDDY